MTHIRKYQDIGIETKSGVRLEGWITLRKGKTIGGLIDLSTGLVLPGTGQDVVTQQIGPFRNIITNLGLDKIADTGFNNTTTYCHAGTGTTTEDAADTALETFLVSTNTIQSSATAAQGTAPYYGKHTKTFRFAQGDAEGNVSEIGFSDQAATGALFSRARVKDGGGSPTTITVLSDEWLDVTYEFRLYPDHILSGGGTDDGVGSITISGNSHDYTIRSGRITNVTYWGARDASANYGHPGSTDGAYAIAYGTGVSLGAVTGDPSGGTSDTIQSGDGSSVSAAAYSNGAYNRNITLTIALGDGNTPSGVEALLIFTDMGAYQILFDPIVPKDATKVFSYVTNLAWARATIP